MFSSGPQKAQRRSSVEKASDNARMNFCQICFRETKISFVYGGFSCRNCSEFFRRSVRKNLSWPCKQIPAICRVEFFRGCCKQCRLDRCYQNGLQAKYIRERRSNNSEQSEDLLELILVLPKVNRQATTGFPFVDAMTQAVRTAFQYRKNVEINTDCHEGEPVFQGFSYRTIRVRAFEQLQIFRCLIDKIPIIGDLDKETKNLIFLNSMVLYLAFIHNYNNSRQWCQLPDRSYLYPNVYMNRDHTKLIDLLRFDPGSSLPTSDHFYSEIAQNLLNVIYFNLQHIYPVLKNELTDDEDIAVFLIFLIIHTNKKTENPHFAHAISQLKLIWKEMDQFYQSRNKDPALWGNLFLLLSNLETVSSMSSIVHKSMHLITGKSVFYSIEKSGDVNRINIMILCKSDS
ncbi:hypothetical protein L596_022818 [Steinernema carpocapsae]|uniref:Nuclear receptor domain-containing protein n=2 Tax=Steinernema carpocapsae TaxID=34508 RepID=A0A4U5MMV9_STECR|nr:hypothetical protein L596_022818 [Steinernema carpocapsae]